MPTFEAPTSGWMTVSIDGDRVTKVKVDADAEIAVDIEPTDD